ncbi:MAG: metal-dependent transcriptional regulator [Filimonas sp.]|nr:metal-dependent transcriptional regulator [Filimonas sp.]
MTSLSEENYLKAIFGLSQVNGSKITPTAIAAALENNPASVIDMLKKLTDKKLINYDKKKGAKLTDKGYKAAVQIVRRHRLWEVFLLDKLGYTWDEVHDIAEQLEHVQQDDLADRLEKFLGYPEYDPHGDPIPDASGQITNAYTTMLYEIEEGKSCTVAAVRDTSTEFLQYLHKLNISIGTKLKVIEKIAFDESVIIQAGKNNMTVSKKFAENILVK